MHAAHVHGAAAIHHFYNVAVYVEGMHLPIGLPNWLETDT